MSARLNYLRLHREWLVSRAAAQRSEISYSAEHLQNSLRWVDRGFAVGRALRTRPVLAVAGAALLLRTTKARRLLWVGQLITAWKIISVVHKQWPGVRFEKGR